MAIFSQIVMLVAIFGSSVFFIPTSSFQENNINTLFFESTESTEIVIDSSAQVNNYIWKYKIENGLLYKRKYDVITNLWIGDWILVGPA